MSTTDTDRTTLQAEQAGYHKTLGRRQVQMIAIGGAIGTGLFLGSASRLQSTGPALVVSYAAVGVIAYFLMRALGELVLHRQTSGAWVSYMREFFGERAAFVTGWMYWMYWALGGIAELSAIAIYVGHWFPQMPKWASVLIALVVVLTVNLLSARAFGEFEFWASILKVGAIVIFLVVGLVLVVGQMNVGTHRAGIDNLWSNPGGFWPTSGAFVWYGPILVMSGVVFAYAAIEMVGVAAGEMSNPEREVPKAVNSVIFRIGVFYCGSILLLACLLPTSSYTSGTSPFVTVFGAMGLTWIGDAIQAILIVAALSSLNSGLYVTGRVLKSLGMSQQAPGFTLLMSRSGVPWAGITMTATVFALGAILNVFDPNAFETALEASALGIIFTWGTIFVCQLRLRQLVDRGVITSSPFRMPGSPHTSITGLAFLALVVVGMAVAGWESSPDFWHKTDFLVVVLGIPAYVGILAVGWRVVRPKVELNTGGRLAARWSKDGPTYPDAEVRDSVDVPDQMLKQQFEEMTEIPAPARGALPPDPRASNPLDLGSDIPWVHRPRTKEWNDGGPQAVARGFHRSFPGYQPTPLVGLPDLAAVLDVGAVWIKDESYRLGLPAFKILGASWAVNRALSARVGRSTPAADLDELRALVAHVPTTLVSATDGNHGRAVAAMAAILGIKARIYVPEGLSREAVTAIADEGAEVVATDLVYDDVVRCAAQSTTGRADDLLIQDTSWPGYEQVPQWIVDGYSTLFDELDQQLAQDGGTADLVAVPTGVGSLLQSALEHYRSTRPGQRPAVLAVEPVGAACVTRSLSAGRPVTVDTSTFTIMAGLNCGTVSTIAWPVIDTMLDAGIGVTDDQTRAALAELGGYGVEVGPCGAAALSGVRAVIADPARRTALGVGSDSSLVLLSTEGLDANPMGRTS